MAAAVAASTAAAAASRALATAVRRVRQFRGLRPSRGAATAAVSGDGAGIEKIGREELEVALANREKPLVVDFFSDWCGPCVMLSKELEGVKQALGDSVRIVKLDTEEEPELASQLGIKALPTMLFVPVDVSKPALRSEGLLRKEVIIDIIENRMNGAQEQASPSSPVPDT